MSEVQAFYERYPYPPPIDDLDQYRRRWRASTRRRADHHLFWPDEPYREDHSVLIAGCGTSQAAKHALRWPAARVTAIDLSATSVRCTEALKRKYHLDNLEVRQLAVERAGELGETFEHIVCTGVLHHLADPDAGLAALRGVLGPRGAMHLMVYAPHGRSGIYLMQDFCKRIGVRASPEGIKDLLAALRLLPAEHPLQKLLREAPDFDHDAALADALLHPQDRAYSVPQFLDYLTRAGLTFGRWIRQAPYDPRCGVLARLPQASRIGQLPIAEQYAAAELFRGTMARHSAVVYAEVRRGIAFDGDGWLSYVPIRAPDTICIEEGLPPGAAAVLINRTHACRDLILPIDSDEKRLLDQIDGEATIARILHKASLVLRGRGVARSFFEKLWRHDQVVFDTSGAPATQ